MTPEMSVVIYRVGPEWNPDVGSAGRPVPPPGPSSPDHDRNRPGARQPATGAGAPSSITTGVRGGVAAGATVHRAGRLPPTLLGLRLPRLPDVLTADDLAASTCGWRVVGVDGYGHHDDSIRIGATAHRSGRRHLTQQT